MLSNVKVSQQLYCILHCYGGCLNEAAARKLHSNCKRLHVSMHAQSHLIQILAS